MILRLLLLLTTLISSFSLVYYHRLSQNKLISLQTQNQIQTNSLNQEINRLQTNLSDSQSQSSSLSAQLNQLLSSDQIKINQELSSKIKEIKNVYRQFALTYENSLDYPAPKPTLTKIQSELAQAISLLTQENYSSASALIASLNQKLQLLKPVSPSIPPNLVTDSTPPASGLKRQQVSLNGHQYWVDIIAADLSTTKVIVDTASNADCQNDCPVKSLSEYVSRSGAFAGINGPYFCPASYPSCASKKTPLTPFL